MVKLLIAAGADVKGRQGEKAIAEVKKRLEDSQRFADASVYSKMESEQFKEVLKILEEAAAK